MATMTMLDAKILAKEWGMKITKNTLYGEYRVAFSDNDELTSYYTEDLDDAIQTMRKMAEWKKRGKA